MKIVGIGAVVMDTVASLDQFPKTDSKMRATEFKQCGGGPCATGLVAASKLGVQTAFIGNLSNDSGGNFLLEDFKKYNVSTDLINILKDYRSFTSQIWLDKSTTTRTIVFDKGNLPALELNESQKKAIAIADVLMVDGNELPAAIEAAKIAKANGTKVLYDAGGLYEGIEPLLELTDILIPSEEFAIAKSGASNAQEAAKSLFEKFSPEVVVVTCGKKGGYLYDGKLEFYPIYPATVLDSNGAGDVFHGAFAAGVVKGFTYLECCHFSSAVSAIKCTKVGAREAVPDFETVLKYLEENNFKLKV